MTIVEDQPAGLAGLLVDHALGLPWESVGADAREAARTLLHDTLCVGVAGARAPHADAVYEVARTWGGSGPCSVLGRPETSLPATSAAWVNAFQIHAQEFDCVHEPAVLHPMATLVAALLAETERSGPHTGKDFLGAIVVGVDVAVALGLAATTPLRFFRPATAGLFGSVAGLCRLRGLERTVAVDAFGHALAFCSGSMQAHVEGKPDLALQVAHAARGALDAVDFAVAGLKGPLRSLDGPFGYLELFEAAHDLQPVIRDLSAVRRITQVSCKPFPTGRAAHGALAAVRILFEEHGVTAANLRTLVFSAPPLISRLVGRRPSAGMEVAWARLCLPYLAAVALTRGEVGLEDFTPGRRGDPEILALAAKITVSDDGGADPAAFTPLVATACTEDGRTVEVVMDDMTGSPRLPLTRVQHLDKARRCLAYSGLEAAHLDLADRIAALDTAPDAAAALRL